MNAHLELLGWDWSLKTFTSHRHFVENLHEVIQKTKGSHSFIFMTVRQHCNLKMFPIKFECTFLDLTSSKLFWLLYFIDILWHVIYIFGIYHNHIFTFAAGFTAFSQIQCVILSLAVFYYLIQQLKMMYSACTHNRL